MSRTTITEALAELKTLAKRIEKKKEFVMQHLLRQELLKDPLEKDGGSFAVVDRERQAIGDLQQRIIDIRTAIARANESTEIVVDDVTRSIAEWLVWRREVAPGVQQFLRSMATHI